MYICIEREGERERERREKRSDHFLRVSLRVVKLM